MLLSGNDNHIAGIGAAIVGFISTIMAVPMAILIGRFIDTTALPVFVGCSAGPPTIGAAWVGRDLVDGIGLLWSVRMLLVGCM